MVIVGGAVLTVYHASRALWVTRNSDGRVPCECDRIARRWSRQILRMAGAKVVIEGAENVDWSAPHVVVANHQSWFDVWAVMGHMPGRIRFVAKEELGRVPIFGPSWQACGHVSVARSDRASAIESLDRAARRVRDDRLTLVLFPEGTRSPDGRLQPFKKGAFVIAIGTGVPIVPIGISGSRAVMPKGSFRVRPGEIRIRVGPPIPVEGLAHEDRDRLLATSRAAIASLVEDGDTALESTPSGNGAVSPGGAPSRAQSSTTDGEGK